MKVFLIAGEISGDKLGANLIEGLKSLVPDLELAGVAGPLMQAQGMQSLFPMDELSIMGIAEVLPKYFHLKRRIRETADAVRAFAPDVVITIDSPDFCLRVAALIRAANPAQKIVHYVAPSVWAWRPKRAVKMAKVVDHVLALLPFEPPYMEAAGMSCDFTGHPVVAEPVADRAAQLAFRAAHDVGADDKLLLVLPGSRRGEIAKLMVPFAQSVALTAAAVPNLKVVLPTPAHLAADMRAATQNWPVTPIILESPDLATRTAAFGAADAALAASGTVSLELAAQSCPMVIAYDMAKFSFWLMKRMALIDTVTLVNLVSETRVVPEFLGPDCLPEKIAPVLIKTLQSGSTEQRDAMAVTMQRLGRGGEAPGLRAAKSVLHFMEN